MTHQPLDAEPAQASALPSPLRFLVSHSTNDTRVRVLWRFIEELQAVLDARSASLRLVIVVSECGGMEVDALPERLLEATERTDCTMMVLTQGYIDSRWCEEEMHGRADRSCRDCPSRRLFPLVWANYDYPEVWGRRIDGWGADVRDLLAGPILDKVEAHLWEPSIRPPEWREAIDRAATALTRFATEVRTVCVRDACPKPLLDSVPMPKRFDSW